MRFAALICAFCTLLAAPARAVPNVIIILADDLSTKAISAYGSVFGGAITTPSIDAVATAGVKFTNAWHVTAVCAPSRSLLNTGMLPSQNHVYVNFNEPNPDTPTVMDLLVAGGYVTWFFGKTSGSTYDVDLGWTYAKACTVLGCENDYVDANFHVNGVGPYASTGYITDVMTDDFIAKIEARTLGVPFYGLLSHKSPHQPWEPAAEDDGDLDATTIPQPSTLSDDRSGRANHLRYWPFTMATLFTTWTGTNFIAYGKVQPGPEIDTDQEKLEFLHREYVREYLETVKSLDRSVGDIITYLAAEDDGGSPLINNTIVCVVSDNGLMLGEHQLHSKLQPYDESSRMVLICRGPGISAGTTQDGMVSNLDIPPTILDAANITEPSYMHGRSLFDLLGGSPSPAWPTAVYQHVTNAYEGDEVYDHYAWITASWKLIHWIHPFSTYGPEWELIDRVNDPNELTNVYTVPANAATIATLKAEMLAYQLQTGVMRKQAVTFRGAEIR